MIITTCQTLIVVMLITATLGFIITGITGLIRWFLGVKRITDETIIERQHNGDIPPPLQDRMEHLSPHRGVERGY